MNELKQQLAREKQKRQSLELKDSAAIKEMMASENNNNNNNNNSNNNNAHQHTEQMLQSVQQMQEEFQEKSYDSSNAQQVDDLQQKILILWQHEKDLR